MASPDSRLIRLARRLNRQAPRELPALIFLTDSKRTPNPLATIARLGAGTAVIFRHYDEDDAQRAELARAARQLCRDRKILFLVAGSARLAAEVRADGVHAAAWQRDEIRRWRRRPWVLTAAAHSAAALRQAAACGADAALLSPVFATPSHPGAAPLGPLRFTALCRQSPLPVYALGGVTAQNCARLSKSGAIGIAGIGLFQDER